MTLQMQIGDLGAGWSDFDLAENGGDIRAITLSYSHASRIDFTLTANETTAPIGRGYYVKVWDDAAGPDILFYGVVNNVTPGSHANEVVYQAHDPTYEAAKSVTVFSLPYDDAFTPPVPFVGAVPRLVYNAANEGDEDYSYSVGNGLTVGGIIAGLLDYLDPALVYIGASPGTAYDSGDLSAMDFVPQEKVVFESVTARAAVEQIWRHEPRFRMFFDMETKLWRFHRLNTGDAITLYLNDTGLPGGATPHYAFPLVGLDIAPRFEDCYTAVSISGPPSLGSESFEWDVDDGGTMEPLESLVLESYSDSGGAHDATVYWSFQITDPLKRPGGRLLRDWTVIPVDFYQGVPTRLPTLLVSWDHGTSWTACANVYFDFLNGIVTFQGGVVPFVVKADSRGQSITPATTQTMFPPTTYKLYWAPYETALSVRYPESGFAGTAYTNYGMERELPLYDESLAIGREFGVPVTSSERRDQFVKLAEYLHEVRKDTVFTGTAVLNGIDYEWCKLGRRVNFADAVDGADPTGWEDINAVVTDVEYTFGDNPTTTLTFNGNWMELYGESPADLRERLRIRSFQQVAYSDVYGMPMIFNQFRWVQNYNGGWHQELSGTVINNPTLYRDQNGNIQKREGS